MWLAPTEETAINVINGHEYTVINSLRSNVLAGLQLWVISYIHSRSVYTALYEESFLPFIPVKFGVYLYDFTDGLIYIGSILFNGWSTANDR